MRELDPQLSKEDVAHLAVALKGLPQNEGKPWRELQMEACQILLDSHEVIKIVEAERRRQRNQSLLESGEHLSEVEAALAVTGDRNRDRGIKRFNRIMESLKRLPDERMDDEIRSLLEIHARKGWTKYFCSRLNERWGWTQTRSTGREKKLNFSLGRPIQPSREKKRIVRGQKQGARGKK